MRHELLLPASLLFACRLHDVPAAPAERDPTNAAASVPSYEPQPNLLQGEVFTPGPSSGAASPHAGPGGHAGHGAPATAPEPVAPKSDSGHAGHAREDGGDE